MRLLQPLGKGKKAKEVGSIDGSGNYKLDFDGDVIQGSLDALPFDKVSGVSISEKQG